jgi:hypothetical protein
MMMMRATWLLEARAMQRDVEIDDGAACCAETMGDCREVQQSNDRYCGIGVQVLSMSCLRRGVANVFVQR